MLAGRKRLIFLDETGVNTRMTRLYGRSPRGVRCHDHAPAGRWRTMTLLGALRSDGVIKNASLLIEGALSGDAFVQWVREQLVPTLRPGDVVVMDNLATHKVAGVQEAIETAGASVWYLPAYSPDLNPIEKLWSKVKSCLRQAAARCTETLTQAVGDALNAVTMDECQNYFNSCGYQR